MQSLGFVAQPGKAKTTEQVNVKHKRRKTNVVVVLDLSGSMAGSNLANAKRELNKLWNLLEKGDSLTIITFSNTVSVAMTRRFKYEPKAGKQKQVWQFDESDLRAVVTGLSAGGGTALYDAVAVALKSMQSACEQDMAKHPNAELHTYQILIITDGQDNSSKSASATSVHATLLHPGKWAGLSHFSSCFVAIGAEAASALAPCSAGLKHSTTVADIDAGFRRLTDTVAQIRTTTVQNVKKTAFAFGGGAIRGA
jgi:Mg-chelatase subunit ChlD